MIAKVIGNGVYGLGIGYLGLVVVAALVMKRAMTIMPVVMAVQLVYLSLATVS